MPGLFIRGEMPSIHVADAVFLVAEVLDIWECYSHQGRYHFALSEGWTLAISADSADRVRIDSCRLTVPVATMWTFAHHRDRLAGLVRKMGTVPEAAA